MSPRTAAPDRPSVPRTIRLAVAGLAAVTLACGGEEEAARGPGASPVEAAVARLDTLSLDVRAVGSLEADAQVQVRPEIDGHVTSIHFREGDRVEEGEVLVRLDQNKLRAQVEAARATVHRTRVEAENLGRRVERNDSLLARGAISRQTFDDLETQLGSARAALEEARANLNLAEEQLEDATIRAPFSGRTGARSFDRGDYVRVGDPLLELVDDQPLEIGFTVPERYLARLRRGSPVSVTVRSAPDTTFRGRVDFVSPSVDPQSRSVRLKARVPNPGAELRAGQFADVRLQLERRPAVMVPEAAVVPRQDGSAIYLVRDARAVRREVRTGARREGRVEILSGVTAGDTVIVAGQHGLQDGAEVRATVEDPDTPADEAARSGDGGGDGASGGDTASAASAGGG